MLEAIAKIGEIVLSEKGNLESLIDIKTAKGKTHIMKINFNTATEQLEIDIEEELTSDSPFKYNLVGQIGGPMTPQFRVSNKYIDKHTGETLNTLLDLDLGVLINSKVKEVSYKMFSTTQEGTITHNKRLLDVNKLGYTEETLDEIYDRISQEKQATYKDMMTEIKDIVLEHTINQTGINIKNTIGMFVIDIDRLGIYNSKEYVDKLNENLKGTPDKKDAIGICNVCGNTKETTSKIQLKLKLYTTNQVIFSNNIDTKNYDKNFKTCYGCYEKLKSGENYIMQNLSTRIYGVDTYIIPDFIYGDNVNMDVLNDLSDKLKGVHNRLDNIKNTSDITNELSMALDGGGVFLINYLMHKTINASVKVKDIIQEVNPTRYGEIEKLLIKSNAYIKDTTNSFLNLKTIYYMYPVEVSSQDYSYRELLTIYKSILKGSKLNRSKIMKNIIKNIQSVRYNNEGYHVAKAFKSRLEDYIMLTNAYIKFLEENNNLEVKDKMDYAKIDNVGSKELVNYIKEIGYNEEQSAMFILGEVLGRVATAQYKDRGNKPILDKLNYAGMDKQKVVRLYNEVFQSMRHEKLNGSNIIVTYDLSKTLYDNNIGSWKLTKEETVYYILSGYAFSTKQSIINGGKKNEENNKQE